jgi:hypothetical protein
MIAATKAQQNPNITIRPTPEDRKIVGALHKKLGVDTSQIFRLAIRVLAAKEGITA